MHLILIDAERSPITYAILLPYILFKVLCRPLVLFIGFDIDINNLKRKIQPSSSSQRPVSLGKYCFKVCKQDFYSATICSLFSLGARHSEHGVLIEKSGKLGKFHLK